MLFTGRPGVQGSPGPPGIYDPSLRDESDTGPPGVQGIEGNIQHHKSSYRNI